MDIQEILRGYKAGEISLEIAEAKIRQIDERPGKGYTNMGFARLDTQRKERSGFPEVIFCSGKPDDYLVAIYRKITELEGRAFGTRATPHQAALVQEAIPAAEYDPVSRILKVERSGGASGMHGVSGNTGASGSCDTSNDSGATGVHGVSGVGTASGAHGASGNNGASGGRVAVCTGGTADIPVAEEAAQTAEFFGARVDRFYDVGVSGIHRLFNNMDEIRKADCVIAVAGMEGALPTVIGGMVRNPVIAVPTSVGYGANMQGLTALLTMINSCANGVAVVNIDNGYGAGYMATQIGRLAASGRNRE
ncbi:nickel pincer cofactor biosynthesis protein LarB [Mogibacterium kristiansenii]|uniref:nickel pincer cofactor biosynthesis protein LarB n=1 Tax=Mogibacterium kristiansenii TaxID=2606708 RepID=UPI0024092FBE|nr:nickel pincer cofactor biosynthesis protein LarB [Mogibacterium kristiansenii]MDD6700242.1 nickel pincer cofactor biosynthesis protein LarB [Mogibacterium kristiansenii]MEE0369027.1 nickel pincer cofactor biosynthesis protein LarB [Clostridia bacterium]